MDLIFVAQIFDSPDHSDLLRDIGAPLASQATSWTGENWDVQPLISELRKFGLVGDSTDSPRRILVNVESKKETPTDNPFEQAWQGVCQMIHRIRVSLSRHYQFTSEQSQHKVMMYFETFFGTFFDDREFRRAKLDGDILVCFNFMPFEASKSIGDKMVQSFQKALSVVERRDGLDLGCFSAVFLIRESMWLTESESFGTAFLSCSKVVPKAIAVIDSPRNLLIYGREGDTKLMLQNKVRIDQSVFAEILRSREQAVIERPLHYVTNVNIGHFILSHSSGAHVRTHYDLSEYVKNHTVIEGIVSEFFELVGNSRRIKLVILGLEGGALDSLRIALLSRPKSKSVSLDYISWDEKKYKPDDILGWKINCDLIVLFTDVVVTGTTVKKALDKLRECLGNDFPVKVYSVIKMKNSSIAGIAKDDFKSRATIKRDYYKDSQTCPMCLFGQPQQLVSGIEDFQRPHEHQPTPLDFWETVADCNALVPNKDYLAGKRLLFRVDTERMVKNYRRWLANLVKSQFLVTWGERYPAAIITVAEPPSYGFARLVQEALRSDDIVPIPRSAFGEPHAVEEGHQDRLNELKRSAQPVLIVDDGMNFGGTMDDLIRFCGRWRLNVIGALVLDSRLTTEVLQGKEEQLQNKPIVALYTWPAVEIKS